MKRPSQHKQPVLCHDPCSNMYKSCGGVCMIKQGHVKPHKCSHCGYTWPSHHETFTALARARADSLAILEGT